MRRRQSIRILDLESRIDQLVSENRLLHDSKLRVERALEEAEQDRRQQQETFTNAVQTRDLSLRKKEQEIEAKKAIVAKLLRQVSVLTVINKELDVAATDLEEARKQKYRRLENDHVQTGRQL